MPLFKWTKTRSVYVGKVDDQHQDLFRLADDLNRAVTGGAAASRLLELAKTLMAALEEHFHYEERLMRESKYSAYNWHKQQHDTVRKRATQFLPRIGNGEADAAPLFLEFLSGWLKDHTGLSDRMFGAHLRNYTRRPTAAS